MVLRFPTCSPGLTVLTLLVGFSMTASAQLAPTCTDNAWMRPFARVENWPGIGGEIILQYTAYVAGLPKVWDTEALLRLDDTTNKPDGISALRLNPQVLFEGKMTNAPGHALGHPTTSVGVAYTLEGRPSDNSLLWINIPIIPPVGDFIRITNVRSVTTRVTEQLTRVDIQIEVSRTWGNSTSHERTPPEGGGSNRESSPLDAINAVALASGQSTFSKRAPDDSSPDTGSAELQADHPAVRNVPQVRQDLYAHSLPPAFPIRV